MTCDTKMSIRFRVFGSKLSCMGTSRYADYALEDIVVSEAMSQSAADAVSFIDSCLDSLSVRTTMSSKEAINMLLDIRLLLTAENI